MDKVKILNGDFFDNNYLNSNLYTDLNKICVENQRFVVNKYNNFFEKHIICDYKDPLVIECKKNLYDYGIILDSEKINDKSYLESLFEDKINEDKLLNCEVIKLEFFADYIKLYLLSKLKETVFLDDDTFISNTKDFISSILQSRQANIPCINSGVDNMYSANNLDFFKEVFEKRKKSNFVIKDSVFIKSIEKANSLKGICHIPFNESLIKKIIVVNNESDKSKILKYNNEKFINKFLFELHIPLEYDEKIAGCIFIDYYSFDKYGKETFNKLKKVYNSEEVIL